MNRWNSVILIYALIIVFLAGLFLLGKYFRDNFNDNCVTSGGQVYSHNGNDLCLTQDGRILKVQ